MCTVIRGLLAIRFESAHQGYLTPMTLDKFMASFQQSSQNCLVIIVNLHLWQFVCLNLRTFIASAIFREMEAHDSIK